jgi:hypothetical protein
MCGWETKMGSASTARGGEYFLNLRTLDPEKLRGGLKLARIISKNSKSYQNPRQNEKF